MPTNDSRFAAASTSPFFAGSGRCCNSAAMGTMKKPPVNPSNDSRTSAAFTDKPGNGQPDGNQRHAESAERHEAVFDFAAGKITRRHAAQADAERQGDAQLADADLVQVQDFRAIKKHIQLQQLAQEEEIRVAEKGEGERPVAANQPELREQIAEKIRVEFPAGIGGGHAGDAEAREEADDRERNQNDSRPGLAVRENVSTSAPRRRCRG